MGRFAGDAETTRRNRLQANLTRGSRRLLRSYLELAEHHYKAQDFPKKFEALERLRSLANPSRMQLMELYTGLRWARLRPLALQTLETAMATAPGEYRLAHFAHADKLSPDKFTRYVQDLGHLPPILYLRGLHAEQIGDAKQAEEYFRRVIEAPPRM